MAENKEALVTGLTVLDPLDNGHSLKFKISPSRDCMRGEGAKRAQHYTFLWVNYGILRRARNYGNLSVEERWRNGSEFAPTCAGGESREGKVGTLLKDKVKVRYKSICYRTATVLEFSFSCSSNKTYKSNQKCPVVKVKQDRPKRLRLLDLLRQV